MYNAEGYPEPTAGVALARVARNEKARRLVYICSPYAGDTEHNIRRARGYCRFAVCKGHIPLACHLLFPQFLAEMDREERELGLSFALVLLGLCDEVWVFGSRVSVGMAQEISQAKQRGMPIRYFTEQCEEVM
ncbi:MAG TPA: DUF4406 domain-containing protein [Clostridiales bacterium]|nr:DUF4406 domain-containing protein [Clostridiales bacterium]